MKENAINIINKLEKGDNFKIAPFRKWVRKTKPHKHNNYIEIIYLNRGSGIHVIDDQEFSISTPVLFVVRQEQVHFWNITSEPGGYVLIIKKAFVINCWDQHIKKLIAQISAFPCLFPKDTSDINQFFKLLSNEYAQNDQDNQPIMEGLLKALLAKTLQVSRPSSSLNKNNIGLYHQFKALLSDGEYLSNKVAYYSNILNTSPQNLNASCRKEADLSASQILIEHLISEAKRLLLYTELTVLEISYRLQFKDNSHFTKYFTRHAGNTPTQFRKHHI